MRSADRSRFRHLVAPIAIVAAAGPVAGCTTTMQEAARVQLNSARLRAAGSAVRVTPATVSRTVRIARLQVVRAGTAGAYVVTVRNTGGRLSSDLPISVGYVLGARRVYLNAAEGLEYFAAHLPAVDAGRELDWVYALAHALPAGARPFAAVGAAAEPAADGSQAPRLTASVARAGAVLSVRVQNESGIPQYQLPVYAVATDRGRAVAAGAVSVGTLAGGQLQTVRVPLVGTVPARSVTTVAVPATIFK